MLILIHEPTSRWTAELEREFQDRPQVRIRWRPAAEDLLAELATATLAVVVVPPADHSLDLIRTLKSQQPQIGLACLMTDDSPTWEWLARECGAEIVLPEWTEIPRVAHSVWRWRDQAGAAGPRLDH